MSRSENILKWAIPASSYRQLAHQDSRAGCITWTILRGSTAENTKTRIFYVSELKFDLFDSLCACFKNVKQMFDIMTFEHIDVRQE